VRTEPRAAEVVGEAFRDFADGKTAGVGGNDGAGLTDCVDLLEQAALDVEVLDNSFDDPVDVGEFLEIVFKIADGDELCQRGLEEGGRLGFSGRVEAGGRNLVAGGAIGVGWNDIEEIAGNAGIGEVRGDAGAHGSGAEDSDFMDAFHEIKTPW